MIFLAGKTPMTVLLAVLQRCKMLVTNDTGPMHAAAAVGTPTVAIFGSTSPLWTRPFGGGHRVLRHEVECSPCFQRTCPIGTNCLTRLPVEEVFQAVREILQTGPGSPARNRPRGCGNEKDPGGELRPLGDAILAGTCFEALREAFPKARITALVQPPAHELYKVSGWVDEVLAYHRGAVDHLPFYRRAWKNHLLVSALRRRHFDLAVDLSASHRSAQMIARGNPVLSIGLGLEPIRGYYGLAASGRDELKTPAVELDRRVLALLGLVPRPHDREGGYWRVPSQALEYADVFWKANRFTPADLVVAVNPFASCPAKEWYPDKWAAVIREMLSNGLRVFFTCAPLERPGLDKIQKALGQGLPVYAGSAVLPWRGSTGAAPQS